MNVILQIELTGETRMEYSTRIRLDTSRKMEVAETMAEYMTKDPKFNQMMFAALEHYGVVQKYTAEFKL